MEFWWGSLMREGKSETMKTSES